ncbi:MAG: PilZ domain-containing protein [Deltaproteobacteria bacterium]|nr:PilZ domain-containing protein [Deltaproteobacteria bacterium]
MDEGSFSEKRRHPRVAFESILFPFLGTRADDHACFQYLLLDIGQGGLRIAIPRWLVNREHLVEKEQVNFHLPFRYQGEFMDQGTIVWTKWDEGLDAQVCGIRTEGKPGIPPFLFFAFEDQKFVTECAEHSCAPEILCRVLKDLFLLKKGVLVYLNHLVPYFSRITSYPTDEYPMLKKIFLDDIRTKVREHQEKIEALYDRVAGQDGFGDEISRHLDLEEVRSLVESELYLEVLKTTFQTDAIMPYLNAIKDLEKRLYTRYNSLVILYVQSL